MSSRKKILISVLVLLLLLAIFWLTAIKFCCCEDDHKATYGHEIINDSLIINSVPFKDTTPFIRYWDLSNSQQTPYKTKKLTSAKIKFFYYFLTFNSYKKKIYQMRYLGLINSILGKKSWYRPKF